jgi:ATP-dependent helicase HepA
MSMEYIAGQRWISHSDNELGLGIVLGRDGRLITLSFPAIGEERTYAIENAPLSRIHYKVGDLITTVDGDELEVLEVIDQQGLLFYRGIDHHDLEVTVAEIELDSHVHLSSPPQRLLNGQIDSLDAFVMRVSTFDHQHAVQTNPARGLVGPRVSLLAHQIYIAREVGQRYAPRVLLADEVGLGKTIEAGLILHQQLITGRAERILVVVPEPLVHQWLVEMLRRFNIHFSIYDQDRMEALVDEDNPFECEQLVLTNLEWLVDSVEAQDHLLAASWDLTIVDEAHHLAWEPGLSSPEYDLVERLGELSIGLLLLTATPEQIGQASHFARLRLLDPHRFHNLDSFIDEEKNYAALNTLLESIMQSDGDISATLETDLQHYLHSNLPVADGSLVRRDKIVRLLIDHHGTSRVMFRNTRDSMTGFPIRVLKEMSLPCPDIYASPDSKSLLYPEGSVDEELWLSADPRVPWLRELLNQVKPQKVLVICANASTAVALEHFLHLRAGVRSAAFYEGLSIIERDRAAAYFAEEDSGAQTLICSEIGSEGRNFQFCQHLVLFDLPLNPDLLEQRIGRLDRIGQSKDIQLHIPYIEGTAQEVLFKWYAQGLQAFTRCFPAGIQVLQRFAPDLERQLQNPEADMSELLADTSAYAQDMLVKLSAGRDRLLELNSCNPAIAEATIEEIERFEESTELSAYMEQLWDQFGVEQDYHSDATMVLRPGSHMLSSQFPGVPEEGVTVCLNRGKALHREDMQYLTWEHPMVADAMDMLQNSELGNTSVAAVALKGINPGTLLLETIYTVRCIAPRKLQLSRFLPLSPMRLLLDANGKDLSAVMPHTRLNTLCQMLDLKTAQAIVKQVGPTVEEMLQQSATKTQTLLPGLKEAACQRVGELLGDEITRLNALLETNGSVRTTELDFLLEQRAECEIHIAHATLELNAVRLIVSR